jgi:signal transduction histidine kinase/BarA-like signal transduction histidine kinase
MLTALNSISILLMGLDQSESRLIFWNTLKIMGTAVKATSVSVWKNFVADDTLYAHRESTWALNIPFFKIPECDNLNLADINDEWNSKDFRPFEINIAGESLDENLRSFFNPNQYGKLHIIPIKLNSEFWGILTFTYSLENHTFTDGERSILNSAGMLFASAINRKEMIRSLYEAKEAALASTKAKTEFLSRMSHEMRTPLNAILGMAKIASESKDGEKTNFYLDRITSSSNQLLAIVNDVLDMSKIDANKMEIVLGEVDIEKLVRYVADMYSEKIILQNLTLNVECDILDRYIIADEGRLSQVLENILSNAVKFTPENGHIHISVRIERPIYGEPILKCEIMDTGIGISKSHIDTLFNAFEQADGSLTRRFGGTGLGLAISKRLMDLMSGSISVVSALGEGSIFIISLPISWGNIIDKTADGESENKAEYNWSGKRILLVEDNEINQEIVIELLSETGIEIDVAENGSIAVNMYTDNHESYDMILMDIQMPVMDGITATDNIRSSGMSNAKRIPIYAMSANAFKEDEEKCLNVGMNGHIPKPIDVDKLRTIIDKEINYK